MILINLSLILAPLLLRFPLQLAGKRIPLAFSLSSGWPLLANVFTYYLIFATHRIASHTVSVAMTDSYSSSRKQDSFRRHLPPFSTFAKMESILFTLHSRHSVRFIAFRFVVLVRCSAPVRTNRVEKSLPFVLAKSHLQHFALDSPTK